MALSKGRARILTLLVVAAILGLYASLVEPVWIEVTRHHVVAPLDPPLRLAHLSDLHTPGMGRRERALVGLLEREKPDAIVITGDTVVDRSPFTPRPGGSDTWYARSAELLDRLRAPLGVWVVLGNWEHERRLQNARSFYERHGVRLLLNEARALRPGVWIAGLDDLEGAPDPEPAVRAIPPGSFSIALFHSPALFDQVAGRFPSPSRDTRTAGRCACRSSGRSGSPRAAAATGKAGTRPTVRGST